MYCCQSRVASNISRKVNGPDGLEAWGVALAACFINFVMGGLGRMSGILYVAFIDIFHIDRLQSSVPFSVRSLTRNLLGPVVGILGQKYGVSKTTVAGAIIATFSSAGCFYANDMLWITILWGVINGIGCALTMTLPQVVLEKHFKKYRTTASGIAFSGGCVGAFLFPVILEYLLSTYGLGGTFLLMAGLIMNVIPAGMVLKEPSWLQKEPKKNIEVSTIDNGLQKPDGSTQNGKWSCSDVDFSRESNVPDNFNNYYCKNKHCHNSVNGLGINTQFLRTENKLVKLLITEYSRKNRADRLSDKQLSERLETLYTVTDKIMMNDIRNVPKTTSILLKDKIPQSGKTSIQTESSSKGESDLVSDVNIIIQDLKDFMWSYFKILITEDTGNLLSVFHEREHSVILKVIHELRQIYRLLDSKLKSNLIEDIPKETKVGCDQKTPDFTKRSNSFFAHAKTALCLHTNPIFLLISFCRSVHFITFVPAVTVIVDYSMDKGLVQEDGKYVIAALSFGDLFGRICLGWVTDKQYLSLNRYMLLVMVLQGACTASLSLVKSKALLLSLIALFGLLQGSLFVRHPVLVSKYLGKNEQSVAMGCFNFFSGLLGFALPSYIGYFRDTIGSYDGMFYINGGLGTVVGIMWIFEPYFVKCIQSNVDRNEQT